VRALVVRVYVVVGLLGLTACTQSADDASERPSAQVAEAPPVLARYTREKLLDPESCRPCHQAHYEEWASSMHAYASLDPVFVAMNQRGQRETKGKLGKFCVQCHAPMALREGLTTDGLNLASLPKWAQGVTCYFCHNAVAYGPDHFNANVTLANDLTMRGSYADAIDPGVHGVARSDLHDRNAMHSARMCGTCHDVVNDNGIHIERTLTEYEASVFSIERSGKQGGDSCQGCHMNAKRDDDYIASMPGVTLPKRAVHTHRWSAVDIALTDDFPGQEEHRRATECALADAVRIVEIIEVSPGEFRVLLETDAGHQMPSGAAQDRRLWLEFVAYDATDKVIYQSGKIADGEVEEHPVGSASYDPALCMLRDRFIDKDGHETHMFWEAALPSQSRLLPPLVSSGKPHVLTCEPYRIPGRRTPARIEVRMKMRPMGVDVLQSLIDSGDLDPKVAARVPTFTLHGSEMAWRRDTQTLRRLAPNWARQNCR
jgi:nitrate/TMAO reductase-like tetraheme cytochrome c subunit